MAKQALLELKLNRAIKALVRICETCGQDTPYPERVGAIESIAAFALDSLGRPEFEQAMIKRLDDLTKSVLSDLYGDRPGSPAAANHPQGRPI